MKTDLESRRRTSVLVVDDSAFMRSAISRMINSDPELHVIATAGDGTEALQRITECDPNVVTLDVEMPVLGGIETLRHIMHHHPRPVIMVSSATFRGAETTLAALSAGAFDYISKRLSPERLDIDHIRQDLVAKIKAAAISRLHHRSPPPADFQPYRLTETPRLSTVPAIVAIGTSTGGPKALEEILPLLPRDLSAPILIVQHMPLGFTTALAARLNTLCSISVREAEHHQRIESATAYIAPAGFHMRVEGTSGSVPIIVLAKEPQRTHIPSVDVMMESVAAVYGRSSMGIIMTGMGYDGATGMSAIYQAGGLTIGQDEQTCAVYSMPRACAELGVLHRMVPLSHIPFQILQAVNYYDHLHANRDPRNWTLAD